VQDPLAEYHFNITPYNYVFNDPLRFIDPFGLDTIPEVTIYGTRPPNPRPSGIINLLWDLETWMVGNKNYDNKKRPATRFEEWCIRNFDMSEVKRIGEIIGHAAAEGTNNNTVETDASYEGNTSDEDIIKENTGNPEVSGPENKTIVITIYQVGKRNAGIWKSMLDYKGVYKNPVNATDTFKVKKEYSTNGEIDSTVINVWGEKISN